VDRRRRRVDVRERVEGSIVVERLLTVKKEEGKKEGREGKG